MTAADPVRAARALRGAAAGVLVLEGIAVLFVPRGIAQTEEGLGGVRLVLLLVLAVVPVIVGVVAWLGLYLRDRKLRALVPLASDA